MSTSLLTIMVAIAGAGAGAGAACYMRRFTMKFSMQGGRDGRQAEVVSVESMCIPRSGNGSRVPKVTVIAP